MSTVSLGSAVGESSRGIRWLLSPPLSSTWTSQGRKDEVTAPDPGDPPVVATDDNMTPGVEKRTGDGDRPTPAGAVDGEKQGKTPPTRRHGLRTVCGNATIVGTVHLSPVSERRPSTTRACPAEPNEGTTAPPLSPSLHRHFAVQLPRTRKALHKNTLLTNVYVLR